MGFNQDSETANKTQQQLTESMTESIHMHMQLNMHIHTYILMSPTIHYSLRVADSMPVTHCQL